jgi:hypothetical protein
MLEALAFGKHDRQSRSEESHPVIVRANQECSIFEQLFKVGAQNLHTA